MVAVLVVVPVVGGVEVGHGVLVGLTLFGTQLMDGHEVVAVNELVAIAVHVVLGHVGLDRLFGARLVEDAGLVVRSWSPGVRPVPVRDQVRAAELVQDAFDVLVAVGVGVADALETLTSER